MRGTNGSRYEKRIVFLCDRSISAEVTMQMVQRFRRLRDNEVVIDCDPRMRDWRRRLQTHSSAFLALGRGSSREERSTSDEDISGDSTGSGGHEAAEGLEMARGHN